MLVRKKRPCRRREKHASWEKHVVSGEDDAGKQEEFLLGAAILTHIGWEDGA